MNPLDGLNEMQRNAVIHKDGPLLLLAGAGSGKTRVITHRIAYLMSEYGVNPYHIMALTFTNKAAKEMRNRIDLMIGYGSESIWVSTFHSTCVKILRRFINRIGYERGFTIYDADDQKVLVREIMKYLNIDPKKYRERTFMNAISSAKDELKGPEEYSQEIGKDYRKKIFGDVYYEYQKRLKNNNALDFDDLIMKTVELFRQDEEVLSYYQERFQYIHVDEYQDTNTAQFVLISLLAKANRNLCVVGDDDQSIYKFRGANIYNILNFEKVFPDADVIRLEQNYRSTANILEAANEVIRHNTMRKEKALWTEAPKGDPLTYVQFTNEYEEAAGIVSDIRKKTENSESSYEDFAVLYRTNAQSRVFEEKFIYEGIPYRIVGAINFYARKEIKDLLAYLKIIQNTNDDISVKRIINVPKRGIGLTTIDRITTYASSHNISFYHALKEIDYIDGCKRSIPKIISFISMIEDFRNRLSNPDYALHTLFEDLLEETGYVSELEGKDREEAAARIENIQELQNKIVSYEENPDTEIATLLGLLEDIALVADIDTLDNDTNQVLLMTLHSAKGLEFPNVYICGMEEGIFPSGMAAFGDDDSEIEEERRLCYVGITRAKEKLTLTCAKQRMRNGEPNFNRPSRFIQEIPRFLIQQEITKEAKQLRAPSYTPTKASIFNSGRKNPFSENPYIQKGFGQADTQGSSPSIRNSKVRSAPEFQIGDIVRHIKFGTGTVKSITKLDTDYEVVIEFEGFGQRKLRTSFAKLSKI